MCDVRKRARRNRSRDAESSSTEECRHKRKKNLRVNSFGRAPEWIPIIPVACTRFAMDVEGARPMECAWGGRPHCGRHPWRRSTTSRTHYIKMNKRVQSIARCVWLLSAFCFRWGGTAVVWATELAISRNSPWALFFTILCFASRASLFVAGTGMAIPVQTARLSLVGNRCRNKRLVTTPLCPRPRPRRTCCSSSSRPRWPRPPSLVARPPLQKCRLGGRARSPGRTH